MNVDDGCGVVCASLRKVSSTQCKNAISQTSQRHFSGLPCHALAQTSTIAADTPHPPAPSTALPQPRTTYAGMPVAPDSPLVTMSQKAHSRACTYSSIAVALACAYSHAPGPLGIPRYEDSAQAPLQARREGPAECGLVTDDCQRVRSVRVAPRAPHPHWRSHSWRNHSSRPRSMQWKCLRARGWPAPGWSRRWPRLPPVFRFALRHILRTYRRRKTRAFAAPLNPHATHCPCGRDRSFRVNQTTVDHTSFCSRLTPP